MPLILDLIGLCRFLQLRLSSWLAFHGASDMLRQSIQHHILSLFVAFPEYRSDINRPRIISSALEVSAW